MIPSPQSPMLKLVDILWMYTSFPQAVTLMKKSGESLMVKPKVNLSAPASGIQAFNIIGKLIKLMLVFRESNLKDLHKRGLAYNTLR